MCLSWTSTVSAVRPSTLIFHRLQCHLWCRRGQCCRPLHRQWHSPASLRMGLPPHHRYSLLSSHHYSFHNDNKNNVRFAILHAVDYFCISLLDNDGIPETVSCLSSVTNSSSLLLSCLWKTRHLVLSMWARSPSSSSLLWWWK